MEFAIKPKLTRLLRPDKIADEGDGIDTSSGYSLMYSNIFMLILAMFNGLNIVETFWIYWIQSVIIGIFNFFRIYNQQNISTEGLTSNGQPVKPTIESAKNIAMFFALHYGFFHFGYLMFVLQMSEVGYFSILNIVLASLPFLYHHTHSFSKNYPKERFIKTNIGTLMFFPYLRIIPMHFAIIFGSMIFNHVLVLIMIKSIIDVFSHTYEHRFYTYKSPT